MVRDPMIKFYTWFSVTIIYSGGILWFSFQPGEEMAWTWMASLGDLLHIPAYFGLAWLMMLAFGERRTENGERKSGIREWGIGNREAGNPESRISTIPSPDSLVPFSPGHKVGWILDFSVLRTPPSVLIFLTATVYGVINEFIQAGVPGRFFSVGDMLRNALGAGLAVWLFRWVWPSSLH